MHTTQYVLEHTLNSCLTSKEKDGFFLKMITLKAMKCNKTLEETNGIQGCIKVFT